ncbi:MAG: CehA/McbA family metallohydrolase [Pyrinomonadaceae bacterium]
MKPTIYLKYLLLLAVTVFLLFFGCSKKNSDSNGYEEVVWVAQTDPSALPYSYVPFDVPNNTRSFSLRVEYDKNNGKNKVDFGLFDPTFSGADNDQKGFRGWSGSIRDSIFISEDSATHGYAPGKLPAGKWRVILGKAAVGSGLYVKIKIEFNKIDAEAKKQFDEENARKFSVEPLEKTEPQKTGEYTWYRGDLHTHSFHSDGYWSVKGIVDAAAARDLDFITVTDHNTYSHQADLETQAVAHPELLVLNGEEITTYGAHINAWGLKKGDWMDFRMKPNDPGSAKILTEAAKTKNAMVGINHPFMECAGCTYTFGQWQPFQVVEVWNAGWDPMDEKALQKWDEAILNYKKITAIGASDTHESPAQESKWGTNIPPGTPTVFIAAKEKTKESLFEGLVNGRVYVAKDASMRLGLTTVEGAMLGDTVEKKAGDIIEFKYNFSGFSPQYLVRVVANAQIAKEFVLDSSEFEGVYRIRVSDSGYVRLEVRDSANNMVAFTNPISWKMIKGDATSESDGASVSNSNS